MLPEDLLRAYGAAFIASDLEAILALLDRKALYELPLLGQRLVGHGEIRVGLGRAFALLDNCSLAFREVKASAKVAIGEGRLQAKLHRDEKAVELPLAVVLEAEDGKAARIATHLDARPYRLWSDGPIFTVGR